MRLLLVENGASVVAMCDDDTLRSACASRGEDQIEFAV